MAALMINWYLACITSKILPALLWSIIYLLCSPNFMAYLQLFCWQTNDSINITSVNLWRR